MSESDPSSRPTRPASGWRAALAVPPRELPVLAAALAALTMLALVAVTGGPERQRQLSGLEELAAIAEVEELPLRAIQPRAPGEPVTAVVRVPDAPAKLARYFEAMDFRLARVREGGGAVPRAFVQRVPDRLQGFTPVQAKKALFLRILLPLVLQANDEVQAQRQRLMRVAKELGGAGQLSRRDRLWLLNLAERYGLPAEQVAGLDLAGLQVRVDVVPPSLALAQAIQESGWGGSRFARQGNALFGQRTWDDDAPGLDPKRADGFKVRAFDSLGDSVAAYLYNLNRSDAYAELRRQRAAMRAAGRRLDGHALAGTLQRYSEEGPAYVRKLRGLMRSNGLAAFDRARLRDQPIAQRVIPDPEVTRIRVALLAPDPES
jgi:Bax protein